MKMAFIRNLIGNETLAKDIYDGDGKPLLKAGSALDKSVLKNLRRVGVFMVYIEDSDMEDVVEDPVLKTMKSESMEQLPNLFNQLLSKDFISCTKIVDTIDTMVNHILTEGTINTNLYEVRTFDNYTYIHSVDTAIMAIFLGLSLKFEKEKIANLGVSAILHDIGKTKLSEELLNKPGKYSEDEFEMVKKHVIYGKDLLKATNMFPIPVIEGVAHHHERVDGTGYPYKLRGKNISEFGRIISICDVFTAISANRSYRERFAPNEAYEYILSGGGSIFDINYVDIFKKTFSIYPLGCCVKLSNDIEGYVIKQNPNFPDRPVIRVVYEHRSKRKMQPYEIDLTTKNNVVISSLVLK
ncbi:MAG: HD-GYP domain-containing protein [Clostridiaceae bacterium]